MIPLLGSPTASMFLEKYNTNRFYPYLGLDCKEVIDPNPKEPEEVITVERNVPYERMMALINSGEMNMVSTNTIYMALLKLQEMGIPLH